MEEFKQSEKKEEKKIGKELPKFKPSKEVLIRFRYNRSFELHLGRNIFIFNGRESKKMPASILTHKDWTPQVAKKFSIQEVK